MREEQSERSPNHRLAVFFDSFSTFFLFCFFIVVYERTGKRKTRKKRKEVCVCIHKRRFCQRKEDGCTYIKQSNQLSFFFFFFLMITLPLLIFLLFARLLYYSSTYSRQRLVFVLCRRFLVSTDGPTLTPTNSFASNIVIKAFPPPPVLLFSFKSSLCLIRLNWASRLCTGQGFDFVTFYFHERKLKI